MPTPVYPGEYRRRETPLTESGPENQAGSAGLPADIVAHLPYIALYQLVMEADGRVRFTFLDERFQGILGFTAAEILANPLLLHNAIHEADVPRFLSAFQYATLHRTPFQIIIRQKHRQGGLRYSLIRSSPRPAPDGAVIWDGIQVDLTDQLAGLDPAPSEAKEFLRVCAWCNRILGPDDAWHPTKGLLNLFSPNRLTHGLCPECMARLLEAGDGSEPGQSE